MYNNTINLTRYKIFKANKLLEMDTIFPKHTSLTNGNLLVLGKAISFFFNDLYYRLKKHQAFNFPKNNTHWIEASANSKLPTIR